MNGLARGSLCLLVATLVVVMSGACGGSDDSAVPTNGASTPAVDESAFAAPAVDTVPLDEARKGELIELPFYPGVGRYGGTKDVSGLDSYEMEVAVIKNIHSFSPNVLIGSPGQEIKLAVPKEPIGKGEPVTVHDFRVSETADFSVDHEVVGEQWKANRGTEFTLTFPAEGSVAFYCSYHLRINMAGMLIAK